MIMKLPKIYYGYKKLRALWIRQPAGTQDREMMIEALSQSMKEIVDKYMEEFEAELYKEVA